MTIRTMSIPGMPACGQMLTACRRWRKRRQRRLAARQLRRHDRPYQLHVGCGAVRIPGWVNIDSSARSAAADLIWDVTDGIPCDDESCALVYNEHFLEHLAVDQGLAFLKECRRVLEPGGVVRVAMPDLAETVRQYVDNDWAEQPWVKKYGFQWIKTRCERLNIGFRWWGHQWLYDREELHRRLGEAGFADVRDAAWGESEVPQLRARETRPETQLICEAWK